MKVTGLSPNCPSLFNTTASQSIIYGILPTRLEAVGLSEYHPVSTSKTLAGRSQNRRIEIALLPDIRELPRAAK
jgi:hypothetical protein